MDVSKGGQRERERGGVEREFCTRVPAFYHGLGVGWRWAVACSAWARFGREIEEGPGQGFGARGGPKE
jgi:hypothetical protein